MCSKQGLTRWYPFLPDNAASFVKTGRKALDPPRMLREEGGLGAGQGGESPDRNESHFPFIPSPSSPRPIAGPALVAVPGVGAVPLPALAHGPSPLGAWAQAELCAHVTSGRALQLWKKPSPGLLVAGFQPEQLGLKKSCLVLVHGAKPRGLVHAHSHGSAVHPTPGLFCP